MARGKNRNHLTNIFGYLVDMEKWERKQIPQANGCIHYAGFNHRQGYQFVGCIRAADDHSMHITAHRLAMRIKLGRDIQQKEQVIHTCSDVRCVNPDHLIIGDTRKRSEIMYANGRQNTTRSPRDPKTGPQTRKYKHTIEEMLFIKNATPKEIAERFKVDSSKASAMRGAYNKGYKWLDYYNPQDKK